ncbi:YhgE/Pip domain-containing protein [Rarobacter incanus]|uniref:Putative membrane protein n=1 Tax=Rarobacter incanus TaxID=153494 RepID=A0A542SMR6_9MICO|nr:YhgE/Pip domain-containing protein [Rarobacter incanus]TQK75924.1 putative membrane protein [Rarobacter incanus]
MSALSTGTELRRFRKGLVPKLAIIAMVLIPLLYGALYLWAFWDPTGRLDNLPVALVNEDQSVEVDGTTVDAGDQVTDELVKSGDLKWEETDAATALQGVKDGRYYFAVSIPKDFSQQIASAAGDDPAQAKINVTYNDANSFLATTLGRSAMTQVESAVREKISDQAVDKVLVGLSDARDGFAQGSDGALQLADAGEKITAGASQLANGSAKAADGAGSLATGAGKLNRGAQTLAAGASSLSSGTSQLSSGASALNKGTSSLASGVKKLSTGAASASDGSKKLAAGTSSLSSGASSAATGASSLADGTKRIASGASQLSDGAASTREGAEKLRVAVSTMSQGFTSDNGILSGAKKASKGATELAEGLAASQATVDQLPTQLGNIATLISANDAALEGAGVPATNALRQQNAAALKQLSQLAQSGLDTKYDAAVAGAQALADKSAGLPYLAQSLQAVSSGVSTIEGQLTSTGSTTSPTLRDGIDQLAAGSKTLSTGASQSAAGASSLAAGTKKLAAGATTVDSGAQALSSGAKKLATGASSAAKGATKVSGATGKLATGASSAALGAAKVASGASQLASGTTSAVKGAGTLADGITSLAEGANKLQTGSEKATAGAQELSDKLADGTKQIPDDTATRRAARATTISAPVSVADTDLAKAEGFGEGFAPFFISLALFVGSLITWLLLRPIPSRSLAAPVSGGRIMLAGYLPAFTIGVGQVLVMLAVIHFGLGLNLANPAGVVLFTMLIAAAFLALQQMFIALFGPAAGKVVILAFLMLQLASSGGTYPVPTTAGFFQALHPWLPMSYSVTGLRQLITGGADSRLLVSIAYLVGLLVVSWVVTGVRAGRMRTWSLDRLHPSVSL